MSSKPAQRHKKWLCPFFRWDAVDEVHCEGGRVCMPTKQHAEEYMDKFCCDAWETCSIAAALNRFYEEDEN